MYVFTCTKKADNIFSQQTRGFAEEEAVREKPGFNRTWISQNDNEGGNINEEAVYAADGREDRV